MWEKLSDFSTLFQQETLVIRKKAKSFFSWAQCAFPTGHLPQWTISNSDFITAWMFVIGEHSLSLLKSNKNCGFTSQERLQIGPEGADAKIPWLISTCVRHNSKKSHCPFSHKSKSSSILALWYKTTCGKRNTVLEEPHIYLDLEIKDGVSQMRSTKDIPSQRNLPGGTGGCLKSCGKTLRVGYWNQAHP